MIYLPTPRQSIWRFFFYSYLPAQNGWHSVRSSSVSRNFYPRKPPASFSRFSRIVNPANIKKSIEVTFSLKVTEPYLSMYRLASTLSSAFTTRSWDSKNWSVYRVSSVSGQTVRVEMREINQYNQSYIEKSRQNYPTSYVWANYRDLSVASRSSIFILIWEPLINQDILRNHEFNNCFKHKIDLPLTCFFYFLPKYIKITNDSVDSLVLICRSFSAQGN